MSMSIILQTSFCFGISTYINSMNSPTWGASMSDELVAWIHFYQNNLSLNFGIYFWSCSLAKDTLMCEVTPGFPLIVVGAQLMLVHRPNYFCTPHNFTFGPFLCPQLPYRFTGANQVSSQFLHQLNYDIYILAQFCLVPN